MLLKFDTTLLHVHACACLCMCFGCNAGPNKYQTRTVVPNNSLNTQPLLFDIQQLDIQQQFVARVQSKQVHASKEDYCDWQTRTSLAIDTTWRLLLVCKLKGAEPNSYQRMQEFTSGWVMPTHPLTWSHNHKWNSLNHSRTCVHVIAYICITIAKCGKS